MSFKKYSLVFTAILFLSTTSTAFATESNIIKPTIGVRQQLNKKVTTLEAKKDTLISQRKTKTEAVYKAIRNQLTQKFDLFTQIKTQIETRISKKEADGKDMTAAKTKLKEFEKYQTVYTADLAVFDTKYSEFVADSNKQSVFVSNLKTAAAKVKLDLNSMRQVLVATLKIIVDSNKLK